jgi:hypothetical protein
VDDGAVIPDNQGSGMQVDTVNMPVKIIIRDICEPEMKNRVKIRAVPGGTGAFNWWQGSLRHQE